MMMNVNDTDMKYNYWHQFRDEINGVENYMNMAVQAEMAGKKDVAKGYREMAKDEFTHAKFLKDLVKDDEVQPPEAMETWNAWHKMLNKFKKF